MTKCIKHEMIFVKRIKSDGNILLNKQCLYCGEADKRAYKLIEVPNILMLPLYDDSLFEMYLENKRFAYDQEKEKERNEWFKNEYEPYLNSDLWKRKRLAVLKRDNYLCQACLTLPATQVHHLSYRHVFNEPLFDLVSVCNQCHDKITQLDRS